METQRRVLVLLPLALALRPALPTAYPHTPSSFYFALPARLSVPGCNLESVSRARVSTDCTIPVWVGPRSLLFCSTHLHQPCFEAPALPCPLPCPLQHPSFSTSVQWCVSMGGGYLLFARDCAELSYSQSFLFPTSWVALESHLWARRGRETIVGEGRDFTKRSHKLSGF